MVLVSADCFSVLFGPRWVVFDVRRLVSGVVWSPLGGFRVRRLVLGVVWSPLCGSGVRRLVLGVVWSPLCGFDVRRLVSGVVWSPLGGSDHMHDSNIGCLVGVDGDLGFWWYV